MTTHDLKTWPEFFEPVWTEQKTAELRRDDRGFAVGDGLRLHEWDPVTQQFSGRIIEARITHIVRGGEWLASGYAMLSFEAHTFREWEIQ